MSLYPVMLITFVALFSMRSIMSVSKFHTFQSPTDGIELPETFTNPFHYTPHPLCLLATKEVQAYLETRDDWQEELEKGKMYFIEIENSFDGKIQMVVNNELPCSTKKDPTKHGIGLRNIRNCAKKYAGDMDCIIEGKKFVLSVMLKGT